MASGRGLLIAAALVSTGLAAPGAADAQRQQRDGPTRVGDAEPAVTVNENVLRGLGRQATVPGLLGGRERSRRGRLLMPNAERGPASGGAQFHLKDPPGDMPRDAGRQPARSPALSRDARPTPRTSPAQRLDRPATKPQAPADETAGTAGGGDRPRSKPRDLAGDGGAPEKTDTTPASADTTAKKAGPDKKEDTAARKNGAKKADAKEAGDTRQTARRQAPAGGDTPDKKAATEKPPAARDTGQTAPARPAAPETPAAPEPPEATGDGPPAAPDVKTARRTDGGDGGSVTATGGDVPGARIVFPAGSAVLPDKAKGELTKLVDWLDANPDRRLKLRAYADSGDGAGSQARRLSLSRALAVRSQLIDQGLRSTRIDVRALGDAAKSGNPDRVELTVAE